MTREEDAHSFADVRPREPRNFSTEPPHDEQPAAALLVLPRLGQQVETGEFGDRIGYLDDQRAALQQAEPQA